MSDGSRAMGGRSSTGLPLPATVLRLYARVILAAFVAPGDGFCPKGFGSPAAFPVEWKIPIWPALDQEEAAKLRTVTLGGFLIESLNEEYLEGPNAEFEMQGHETYWQSSGSYFMYYCQKFRKWRVAGISAFGHNKNGDCFGFVSDSLPHRDIRNSSFIKGWIEVENGQWKLREEAGVVRLGTLADQLEPDDNADGEDTIGEGECSADPDSDSPFTTENKTKKSNCPVMPIVRKAGQKVKEAGRVVGTWMRRLFPKLLAPPPSEEDTETRSAAAQENSSVGEVRRNQWARNRIAPNEYETAAAAGPAGAPSGAAPLGASEGPD